MTLDDDDERPDREAVERRRALRGPVPGLRIDLLAPRAASFEAVEASPQSFFVRAADPEAFRLGDVFDAIVEQGVRRSTLRLEVIRKELHPRSGVALRVASVDPQNRAQLEGMLAPLADPDGEPDRDRREDMDE